MKPEELIFPITVEAFVAFQEGTIGRELTAGERECVDAWLPAINIAYAEGLENDTESFRESLEKVDGIIVGKKKDSFIRHFLEAVRWWMGHAWERGRQDARKGAAV